MGWKEDRKQKYLDKLKDPRWQQARLKVFERDNWTCQYCLDTGTTLNVHHLHYIAGREPWEYELDALMTLCERCHKEESELRPGEDQALTSALKWRRWSASQVNELACNLMAGNLDGRDEVLVSAWLWVLRHPDELKLIRSRYMEELERRANSQDSQPAEGHRQEG